MDKSSKVYDLTYIADACGEIIDTFYKSNFFSEKLGSELTHMF